MKEKIGPKVELAHTKATSWFVKVNGKLTTNRVLPQIHYCESSNMFLLGRIDT
jgi:hypothetical protein